MKNTNASLRIGLFVMLFFSFCMGIPTNLGFYSLYGDEFEGPVSEFHHGYALVRLVLWIPLVLSHTLLLSMPFLTGKSYFKRLLIQVPAVFLILFASLDPFALLLLIPFIISWIICLVVLKKRATPINN